jgi:hypothetical protein
LAAIGYLGQARALQNPPTYFPQEDRFISAAMTKHLWVLTAFLLPDTGHVRKFFLPINSETT